MDSVRVRLSQSADVGLLRVRCHRSGARKLGRQQLGVGQVDFAAGEE